MQRRMVRNGLVCGLLAAACFAGQAAAHVSIRADPPQVGAEDALLTIDAEAESSTAGVVALEVVSPDGVDLQGTALAAGPAGWELASTDRGVKVSGPPVRPRSRVEISLRVPRLPTIATTEFRVLQTYSDGRVDRWIGERTPGQPEPDHPAALLTLTPAPTTSTTEVSTTVVPTSAATPTITVAPADAPGRSSNRWPIVAGSVVAAVLVAIAATFLSRRRAAH